jgi:hypothetical protein
MDHKVALVLHSGGNGIQEPKAASYKIQYPYREFRLFRGKAPGDVLIPKSLRDDGGVRVW